MTTAGFDFDKWVADIPQVREVYVITGPPAVSPEIADLEARLAALTDLDDDDEDLASTTAADLREQIATLKQHTTEVPGLRVTLRGYSDLERVNTIRANTTKTADGKEHVDWDQVTYQLAAIQFVDPALTGEQVRMLHQRLSMGQWAALMRKLTELAEREGAGVDLPNS